MTTYFVEFNGRKNNAIGIFTNGGLFIDLEKPLSSLVPGDLPIEVFAAIQNAGYESRGILSIKKADRPETLQ